MPTEQFQTGQVEDTISVSYMEMLKYKDMSKGHQNKN